MPDHDEGLIKPIRSVPSAPVRRVRSETQPGPVSPEVFLAHSTLPLLDNIQSTRANLPRVVPYEVSLSIPASMVGGLAG
ncbi:hypothetical protein JST97_25390 [bacterium]|nr:hypothetical protein [bacterium]